MTLAQIIANLPALVVAIPLLLAPVAALLPYCLLYTSPSPRDY